MKKLKYRLLYSMNSDEIMKLQVYYVLVLGDGIYRKTALDQ